MLASAQTVIDAECRTPSATVQLARFSVPYACECDVTQRSGFRLTYFSRRPPNAGACAIDRWPPNRFEPLGDVFLLPQGEPVLARGDAGDASAVYVQLEPDLMQTWFGDKHAWSDTALAACFSLQSGALREVIVRMSDETAHPGFASAAMIEALAIQASVELARHCRAIGAEPARGGIQSWRLRIIDERLAEFTAPPTLSELARLCNLSARQLARTFRATFGTSIGDYVAQRRIEYAKRLLRTDKSIKIIAHELGFNSTSGFCFSFRRATGQSPGRFRLEAGVRNAPPGN